MLEMSYPEPKQTLGRWKRRIRSQNKLWDAGNVVSCAKTNVGKPETPYPEARGTPAPPRRLTKDRRKPRKSEKTDNKIPVRLFAPSKCRKQDSDKVRTKKLTIFVGIL